MPAPQVLSTVELRKHFQQARTEFKELSIQELKEYEKLFLQYDSSKDGFIDLQELKYMVEKLGFPQTHLGLKAMIKEVDEDNDGVIAYREFLLIFRYAKSGTLTSEGLKSLAGACINVEEEGVGNAKSFFEQKAAEINDTPFERDAAYRAQVKQEREEKAASKKNFKDRAAMFQ